MAADAKAAEYKMMAEDAEAARMAAVEAQMAADAKAAEYKMMAEEAEAARMAAVEAQMAADTKAADYKKMAEDAEAARMTAVEAQNDAEDKAADYKQQRDNLQAQLEGRDVDSSIDAAKKLNDALMGGGVEAYMDADDDVEAMVRNMAVEPRSVTASIDGELSVSLRHVTIDDNDATPDDDGREAGATLTGYERADVPAEDELDGWRGVILTNDDANAMAVVYSNIVDTTGGRFDNRYSATLSAGVKRYQVDGSGNIPWSDVRRDTTATTITDRGGAGDTEEDVHMFAGSVHNVSGDFSCMGDLTTCVVVTRLSDGRVAAPASGTWRFTPDNPDATISTVIDDEFLTLGWWLNKGDGTQPYYFDAFAAAEGMDMNGDDPTTDTVETVLDVTVVTALQGTAEYEGVAVGKYSILDANADVAEGGHFTASAMLEADFNAATDETADTPNTNGVAITGMIDDFMTGATPRPGWEVELMAGDAADADEGMQNYANLNSGVMGSTEWTMGGAAAPAEGDWMGDVYGGGTNDFPDAMTGTFNASGTIGRISGAFGVEEE